MSTASLPSSPAVLPDHTQLPESDGTIVHNFQEHPQSLLLTDSLTPVLRQFHPDGQYCIGQDCGIFFRHTQPPLDGCKAPDWFYVPDVPPMLDGQFRRSYVLWQEVIPPLIILEYASGNGAEERDETPWEGKFWVYERAIRPTYYGIFLIAEGRLEFFMLTGRRFRVQKPNERGHYPITELGVELGIWRGLFQNAEAPWLRWWDGQGQLLLTGDERAERERQRTDQERQRAERERQRAEHERQRAERLAAQLRALGMEPEA